MRTFITPSVRMYRRWRGQKQRFWREMAELGKVRDGSNAKQKRWKAHKYWGFWIASLCSQRR